MKIRGRRVLVYDLESFQNVFTCSIKDTETKKKRCFRIGFGVNDMPKIKSIFSNNKLYWCGFNNKHYDDLLISYILIHYDTLIRKPEYIIADELKRFSDTIINSDGPNPSLRQYKYAKLFYSVDLAAMMFSAKIRSGLKELQVTMDYPNVEEYKGDFSRPLPEKDLDAMIAYNFNDVESTEMLLQHMEETGAIALRLDIEDNYHIPVLSKDGVNIGMEILKSEYLKATGKTWEDIKDLRSPADKVDLGKIIFPYIKYDSPELTAILDRLKATTVDPKDKDFKIEFSIGGVAHTLALGGLHSQSKPEIFDYDESYVLDDEDVTSLYPSIVIENNLYPKHLGPEFVKIYKDIRTRRVAAKKAGKTNEQLTLKLALNGCTGMFQMEHSWVFDPELVLTIRMNGQLMLLMFIEKLVKLGAQIINSNTDGVFYRIKKEKLSEVKKIQSWWENITHLGLESDTFERFYQYAVNDYLGVKTGWKDAPEEEKAKFIKRKGLFLEKPELGKGLAPRIIAKAINDYFILGVNPEVTIYNCQDIKQFCTYQKVDRSFTVIYGDEQVPHINRFYMSTNGKPLIKRKYVNYVRKDALICATSPVTIYNKMDDLPINKRAINYPYYMKEAYKIINALTDKQLSLWD